MKKRTDLIATKAMFRKASIRLEASSKTVVVFSFSQFIPQECSKKFFLAPTLADSGVEIQEGQIV